MVKRFNEVSNIFPDKIRGILINLPYDAKKKINEIRIRLGKPIILNLKNINFFIDKKSNLVNEVTEDILFVTKKDILETFEKICNYSIYSYQDEIKNGFVTLKGGHRIGICGTAVFNNKHIDNIRNISSMNIRISKEISNFNVNIYDLFGLDFIGILIIGSPGSGKTTLLKSLARTYSTRNKNALVQVCVIDERGELSGTYLGEAQNDLGYSDILNGYRKSDGINHAIRSLSPDIIICDEIMENDLDAIKHGINSGVKFIVSVHARNSKELINKPFISELISLNAFDKFVFLSDKSNPSTITKILTISELLKKEKLNC